MCVTGVLAAAAIGAVGSANASAPPVAASRVIVLLKAPAGSIGTTAGARVAHAAAMARAQQPAAAQVEAAGGRILYHYSLIDGFAATATPAAVLALTQRSDVAAVVPDRYVRITPPALRSRTGANAAHRSSGQAAPMPGNTQNQTKADAPAQVQPLPALDPTVCPSDPSKPLLEPEALSLMRADSNDPSTPSAADYATGAGVRVGIVANGFDPANPDLQRNGSSVITTYKDFAGTGTAAPADSFEAMGDVATIAAQGNTTYDLSAFGAVPAGCTIRVRGVAPGADIVALKAFDGESFYSSVATEAIDYAVTVAHVDVLSESLGGDAYPDGGNDPISLANAAAVAAGVTIATATGDAGAGATIGAPASALPGAAGVISVGATTQLQIEKQLGYYRASRTVFSGDIANLSSSGVSETGRIPDAVAPGWFGWSLCTDDPSRFLDCPVDPAGATGLSTFGGTSESAPMTAGVAALVIQRYRDTHAGASPAPQVVKRIITSTSDDVGAPAQEQGAGEVDALRAVQLAGAINRGTNPLATRDLLVSPTSRTLVIAQGAHARTSIQLANPTASPRQVTLARRAPKLLATARLSTTLTGNFAAVPFSVRPGTDRFEVIGDVPAAASDYPDLELIDPNGNVANESGSEGPSNTLRLDVDHPAAGDWQLFVITYSYNGPASAQIRSYRNVSTPLAAVTVPARSTRSVGVPVTGSPDAGDSAFAVTVSDAHTGAVLTGVPVIVRTPVSIVAGHGAFRGDLEGGNGRPGFLAGSANFEVPVRAGTPALRVALRFAPGQHIDAYLTAPSGSALDEASSLPAGATDPASGVGEIDLSAVHPLPGLWQVTFGINGPIAGTAPRLGYTGRVNLTPAAVTITGLPDSAGTALAGGVAHHVTAHILNDSSVPHAYIIDPRLDGYAAVALQGSPSVEFSSANELPAGTTVVPPQTRELTSTMTAKQTLAGTLAPQEISFPPFNGDPETYQVSPSGRLHIDVRAPELQNGPWLELPVVAGPFDATGTGPVTIGLQATALTRPFDPAITSSAGDPWPATVGDPQTVTPVAIPAHSAADVAVTITPSGPSGTVVRGNLFVDDWNPTTKVSGEIAAVPYAYRIG